MRARAVATNLRDRFGRARDQGHDRRLIGRSRAATGRRLRRFTGFAIAGRTPSSCGGTPSPDKKRVNGNQPGNLLWRRPADIPRGIGRLRSEPQRNSRRGDAVNRAPTTSAPPRRGLVATQSPQPTAQNRSAEPGLGLVKSTPLPLRTGPCRPRTCRVHRRSSRGCRGCRGRRNRRRRSRFRSTRRRSRCS